jgi:exodeoxyribonuclease V alpha subunit
MCREACRLLGLSWDVVSAELPSLETAGDVVLDGSAVYLTNLLKAEHAVSCNLLALMSTAPGTEAGPADFSIMPFELDIRQKDAIESGRHSKVLVITGGPGTGKTTLCRVLLTAFKGQRIALASPTGVAAKRIATATGLFASTIHRLLEYHPHLGWRRNQRNQLDADIVLVDEVSMVDINLMKRLTDAIPPTCRLILVGDADQLPSVGPGRVLGDIITSGKIPIVELTQIQRQGPLSKIIVNAHRVNHGLELDLPEPPDNGEKPDPTDFYMIRRSTKEGCAQLAVELASEILPDRFGYDPMADIWVITPQNVGDCGTVALNAHLQAVLNPNGEKVPFLPKKGFRIGDLAMQWKNDYELGVFNGDRGRILSFDEKKEEMTVQIEGENSPTVYGKASASNLRLAYASTVHKSQGNERKCVVLVMHKTHTRMLQRSLLYTGMTRAVELLIIIGQMHAVQIATRTVSKETRHSGLGFRLSESEGESSPILVEADGVDPLGIS